MDIYTTKMIFHMRRSSTNYTVWDSNEIIVETEYLDCVNI